MFEQRKKSVRKYLVGTVTHEHLRRSQMVIIGNNLLELIRIWVGIKT